MIKYSNTFSLNKITEIRRQLNVHEYNMFEHLMELLRVSKNIYGINFTESGKKIKNLNRMEDERLSQLGIAKIPGSVWWPPNGLDAYVEIDINLTYVDQLTESLNINIINIIFHELFECYVMTDVGLQYREAHQYVGIQEEIFMKQYPGLSQCFAFLPITLGKHA